MPKAHSSSPPTLRCFSPISAASPSPPRLGHPLLRRRSHLAVVVVAVDAAAALG
uniref:Uncharacterized protein n=1 Tax=Oryza sativa subsp. japonica TaxID=39947 RepID=Q6Z7G2_ORYSJ|nr:hypothetical protein [Oryza sativa Japonica Group]BAD17171.1 hypothetical protein [Oryza sativa Japonica Group]